MSKRRFKLIAAVYLILIEKGKILLSKRYNTEYEDGKYSFIAGHVDGDETLRKALIREAHEEAGINISQEDLNLIHIMHRNTDDPDNERLDFFFSANQYRGKIKNSVKLLGLPLMIYHRTQFIIFAKPSKL